MISSSIYLFISYFRLGMSLPILESHLKKYVHKTALNFEHNINYLAIKNKIDVGIENYNSTNKSPLSLLPNIQEIPGKNQNKVDTYSNSNYKRKLPFVSVIVPVRNEGEHIERCLLSILSQNYP